MRNNFCIVCDDDAFSKENIARLEKVLHGFVKSDVKLVFELVFVDSAEIRRLNGELRGVDKVTDVLSFPSLDGILGQEIRKKEHLFELDENGLTMGSIAICEERAKEQAEEYGHSYERELHYLIVHGILHCLGYDHIEENDRALMREKEELLLGKLGITRE